MAGTEETGKFLTKNRDPQPFKPPISVHAFHRPRAAETPFIFMDGTGKTEPAKRKIIRKHVMLGKNRGKTRSGKPRAHISLENFNVDQGEASGLSITMRYSTIPSKVGSEISFTQFAAALEPPLVHDVLRFSLMAKRIMYPLESCIMFHRKTEFDRSWFELLTSDAAYMHAAVFASQAYVFHTSARKSSMAARNAMEHHSESLRLLRARLSFKSGENKITDATILVVLYLALHAYFLGDYSTANHHMEGLRNIVNIRGGLIALGYNSKLVMELLKCDLSIALNNGTGPLFYKDASSEPLVPYNFAHLATEKPDYAEPTLDWKPVQLGISANLVQAWSFLTRFCSVINTVAESKRQLPKETLLNAMASVMYRLLRMDNFDPTSVDEAIRLGLLVFSSHIFLNWRGLKPPRTCFPSNYKDCLLNLNLPDTLPPKYLLWLLVVGSLSVFTPADNAWLLPWVRANIDLCRANSWIELREQLKTLLWIDILHDEPGRAIFEAAMSL